jgi:WD40 repeat protein
MFRWNKASARCYAYLSDLKRNEDGTGCLHWPSFKESSLSHDSKLLASASEGRTVKVWDAAMGSLQQILEGHIPRSSARVPLEFRIGRKEHRLFVFFFLNPMFELRLYNCGGKYTYFSWNSLVPTYGCIVQSSEESRNRFPPKVCPADNRVTGSSHNTH